MEARRQALIQFLQEEMAIPSADLQLAMHHTELLPNLFPMVLWQYGLVNITQLDQIFDWLEQAEGDSFGF